MNHSDPSYRDESLDDDAPFVIPGGRVSDEEPPMVLPARRPSKWWIVSAAIAWLVVVAVIVINLFFTRPSPLTPDEQRGRTDVELDMQGRYLVGAAQMQGAQKSMFVEQLPALEAGRPARRHKITVLTGELAGPDEALKRLEDRYEEDPTRARIQAILDRLYTDYDNKRWQVPNVTNDERAFLKHELGWFGELALAPAGGDPGARQKVLAPAWRTLIVFVGVLIGACALAAVGFMALLVLAVYWWMGRVRSGMGNETGRVAVWAETFGLYMFVFLALGAGFSFLKPPFHRAALSGIAALSSMVVLVWPRIRGLSWLHIREAIGLTAGRGLFRELALGVATYVMTLPFMGVGLIITLILMMIARKLPGAPVGVESLVAAEGPSHPIVPMLVEGHWSVKLLILVLAAVIAPVVEETMFRGVLYRHLREATGRLGGVLSFLLSATVVGFVFAAIHPQGWMGIPALMGIAFGLNLAREWRGTLIPSMVAHGINNATVVTLVVVVMS